MGTISKKKITISLICSLALVMMMSTCAFADTTFGNDNDTYTTQIMGNQSWSCYEEWYSEYWDQDCIDLDNSMLCVGIDYADLYADNNSGIIVQDSQGVSVIDVSDIVLTLDVAITDSFNEDSYNITLTSVSNQNLTNVQNVTWTNVDNNNEYLCDNTVNITVDNVLNDYSDANVGNDCDTYDIDLSNIGNDTGSYNDFGSGNSASGSYTENIDSYNYDCDFNGNAILLPLFQN